jgi:protein phosphatase
MVRRGELTAAQAAIHPHRSVITRALGTEGEAAPDLVQIDLEPGDRLMLCSDGLSGMVADEKIEEVLLRPDGPQAAADALVQAALEGGGEDNVTVVVVDVVSDDQPGAASDETADDDTVTLGPADRGAEKVSSVPGFMRPALGMGARLGRRPPIWARPAPGAAPAAQGTGERVRWSRRRWIVTAAVVVVVLALAVAAFAVFNSSVYYVGNANGVVALYQGLPTALLGIHLSSVVELGTVGYDSLAAYQRERVDSHDLVGKEEGQAFLRGLAVLQ